jgi:hypothetical protein
MVNRTVHTQVVAITLLRQHQELTHLRHRRYSGKDASFWNNYFECIIVNVLCGYVAYLYYMGYRINFELYIIDYDHDHCTKRRDVLSHTRDAHGGPLQSLCGIYLNKFNLSTPTTYFTKFNPSVSNVVNGQMVCM